MSTEKHISILIDGPHLLLFAETGYGSDYLRQFAIDVGWKWEVGHGSKELNTYKDYTVVVLDAREHKAMSRSKDYKKVLDDMKQATINEAPERRPCGHNATGWCLSCGKQFCDQCEGLRVGFQRIIHDYKFCKKPPVP